MGIRIGFVRKPKSLKAEEFEPPILRDFNRSLTLMIDSEALRASIAIRLSELFGSDRIVIFQMDQRYRAFYPTFHLGFNDGELDNVSFSKYGRLAKWLQMNETWLAIPDSHGVCEYLSEEEREVLRRLGALLCVPLIAFNRLTGILLLGFTATRWQPSGRNFHLLQAMMAQVALALENARLYEEQRDRLYRMHRAERLAATGQLAAGVAHEIRNPLTAIRCTIQYVLDDYPEASPKRPLLQEVLSEVDRINRIVIGLLDLTRFDKFQPEPVDVADLLVQSLDLVSPQAQCQNVALVGPDPSGQRFFTLGETEQLKQVFLNLLLNALQAVPHGGRVEINVTEWEPDASLAAGQWMQISINDTGVGIPADYLDSIFEPFFTTKPDGTGLGLSICHSIIQRHGGEIDVKSEEGRGTTVFIRLPLCSQAGLR